jgi:hypothetical protein
VLRNLNQRREADHPVKLGWQCGQK